MSNCSSKKRSCGSNATLSIDRTAPSSATPIPEATSVNSSPTQSHEEKQQDFYQILGVSEDASYPEIKKKWLKLSMLFHPDKCGGDNEKYRQINLAYKVLSNPDNRKKYNDSLAKTFNQLKDEGRDVEYHVNVDYLDDGNKFARDKFLEDFERTRSSQQNSDLIMGAISEREALAVPKLTGQTMMDLMNERNREFDEFTAQQQTQRSRSDIFDPTTNPDEFNFIFSQYQKLNGNRTDIEEVVQNHNEQLTGFSDLNQNTSRPVDGNVLRQLTSTLLTRQQQQQQQEPARTYDEQREIREIERQRNLEHTNSMLLRLQAERQAMEQIMEENRFMYHVNHNDNLLYDGDVNDSSDPSSTTTIAMSLDSVLGNHVKND